MAPTSVDTFAAVSACASFLRALNKEVAEAQEMRMGTAMPWLRRNVIMGPTLCLFTCEVQVKYAIIF